MEWKQVYSSRGKATDIDVAIYEKVTGPSARDKVELFAVSTLHPDKMEIGIHHLWQTLAGWDPRGYGSNGMVMKNITPGIYGYHWTCWGSTGD